MRGLLEGEPQLSHLIDRVWRCPSCKAEAIRYDWEKKACICWECCKVLSVAEANEQLYGFKSVVEAHERNETWRGHQYFGYGDGHE